MSDTQTWTSIIGMLTFVALVLVVLERATNHRFKTVDQRFDGLGRDVALLVRRELGDQ
ncbi:MAG: hypothetical protein ACJ72E_06835 [Marmoricola sp.]